MKKILLSFFMVILSALCLLSCGKDKNNTQDNGSEDASAESGVENTAENIGISENDGGDVSSDSENGEKASGNSAEENNTDVSGENSEETVKTENETENRTDNTAETKTEDKTPDNAEDEAAACTAVWVSTEVSLDGVKLDPETDGKMEMQLALFDDGEYIMAAYLDGEMLENYPQQYKYELADGALKLASGWSGEINGEKMDLSYSDGEATVTFHCTLAARGE